jgi:tetratricopeptide (TPR) repeat protein
VDEEWTDKAVAILQKAIWPVAVVVVLAIGGGVAYSYNMQKKEKALEAAQDELFVIRKDLEKITATLEPKPEPTKDGKPAKKAPPQASEAEQEKAYAPDMAKLQTYIKANQGNQAAVEGAMLASEISSHYKKYDEGVTALNTALQGFDKKNFLFGIAQTELGNLYTKIDKCNEAAQAWEAVIAQKAHDYLATELRLKAGICYEKIGMYDKAEGLYQAVIDKAPTSSAARTAKKFLLHIQYVKTKPNPAQEQKKG